MKRFAYHLTLISLYLFISVAIVRAQESTDILGRINALRTSLGLAPYALNGALSAAANNHASWMVETGQVSHTQSDGSTPSSRAAAAGYFSPWISENIYGGTNANVNDAWNFWINSNVHYRGLTNPNYQDVGIGIATSAWGKAYVLVFGNSSGNWDVPGTGSAAGGGDGAAAPPPSFVVGIDAFGNIMHEIQAGQTLGDIALIYGYTWDDLPYMLQLNEMAQEDVRELEVGGVFLVPPKSGTYTPTPAPATNTPTPQPATNTPVPASPTTLPSSTPVPTSASEIIEPATFIAVTTNILPDETSATLPAQPISTGVYADPNRTETATPQAVADASLTSNGSDPSNRSIVVQRQRSPWFLVAVVLQVVVLLGAGFELLMRLLKRK